MVYRTLLHAFQQEDDDLAPILASHFDSVARVDAEALPLLPDMKELRVADNIVGKMENNSDGPRAEFTDDSDAESTGSVSHAS
jgi:hypothetical protein